ncbi:recombination-associated protein RdgC [Gilliamella intestini]|uniref:Recombination-associated protein RdgC n=1 Tax=Gilliamella intestini TaxID=1798183 RepID=A0A1C4DCA6_9GAMM|nr:recombination-associated protein RdgC [Gilliamella intestini]SCC28878.1 recombination associated protein RdgC [Gilliamella intestini]
MFFKNLIIYQFDKNSSIERLDNDMLKNMAFTPCGPTDSIKKGFVSPIDDDDVLKLQVQGHSLLKLRIESKLSPSSVIKKKTSERIEQLEQKLGRSVTKSERLRAKDDVIVDLLPIAFTKDQYVYVWINDKDKFIAVETASFKKAEDVLALIRKELGALALKPLSVENNISFTLKEWVCNDSTPPNFFVLNDAMLADPLEGNGKIKLIDENLTAEEVKSYLNGGREIKSLSFSYKQQTVFTVNTELVFSKISYSSEMLDENSDISLDDKAKRIEADFFLVANELANLIKDFTKAVQ